MKNFTRNLAFLAFGVALSLTSVAEAQAHGGAGGFHGGGAGNFHGGGAQAFHQQATPQFHQQPNFNGGRPEFRGPEFRGPEYRGPEFRGPEGRGGEFRGGQFGGRSIAGNFGGRWNYGRYPNLGFYRGYNYGGRFYPFGAGYFAFGGFCATEWMYNIGFGWYHVGFGYVNYAPQIAGPITVSVPTTVVVGADAYGNEITETETMLYNAYWYPQYGQYGYTDYQGYFHLI